VAKRYTGAGAAERQAREAALLRLLSGSLPVPEIAGERPGVLRLHRARGVAGDDLLAVGQSRHVLGLTGSLLRRIQRVDVTALGLPGDGPVLVHGDYGPQRLRVDGHEVTAVLDWDLAHAGEPLEDLAWAEWSVRMHHPEAVADLDALFDGYGDHPSWQRRRQAMTAALARREARADDPAVADMWRGRREVARSWTERAA